MTQDNLQDFVQQLYSDKPPAILSHYTSIDALVAICDSKSLLASDVRFLNDAQELSYFGQIFESALNSLNAAGEEARVVDAAIDWLHSDFSSERLSSVCAISLSENSDQLSQWRAYTELRRGVSIGFSTQSLLHLANQHDYFLGKCIYDEDRMSDICTELASIVVDDALKFQPSNPEGFPEPYSEALAAQTTKILRIAALFKNPAFSEEAEWRLVTKQMPFRYPERTEFRAGKEFIIPYVRFPISLEGFAGPMAQIVVGPSTDADLSIKSIAILLASRWMQARPMAYRKSKVPLR